MIPKDRETKTSYIISRSKAKGNENGPRKKKFVISLQTCRMGKHYERTNEFKLLDYRG